MAKLFPLHNNDNKNDSLLLSFLIVYVRTFHKRYSWNRQVFFRVVVFIRIWYIYIEE